MLMPQPRAQSSESKSVRVGPLRGVPGTPAALLLTQPQPLPVATARNQGTSLPGTGTLGWGARGGAEIPRFSRGNSAVQMSLPVRSAFLTLLLVSPWFLLYVLSYRTLQLDFKRFSVMVVL